MTTIDKTMLKNLRDDIDAALIEVGEKYGITLHAGNCSFDAVGMTYQLKGKVNDTDAIAAAAQKDFEQFVRWTDVDPRAFGQTFTNGGKTFTVTGVKPRNRKYPILATATDGGVYKFPLEAIARHFPKTEAEA